LYDRVWDRIGDVARLAPTPHNTQPFRIVPLGPQNADLVVVRERLLPREDHGNLYMACAFGIFATALEHAARFVGRDIAIDVVPRVDLARLHAGGRRVLLARSGRPARFRADCQIGSRHGEPPVKTRLRCWPERIAPVRGFLLGVSMPARPVDHHRSVRRPTTLKSCQLR